MEVGDIGMVKGIDPGAAEDLRVNVTCGRSMNAKQSEWYDPRDLEIFFGTEETGTPLAQAQSDLLEAQRELDNLNSRQGIPTVDTITEKRRLEGIVKAAQQNVDKLSGQSLDSSKVTEVYKNTKEKLESALKLKRDTEALRLKASKETTCSRDLGRSNDYRDKSNEIVDEWNRTMEILEPDFVQLKPIQGSDSFKSAWRTLYQHFKIFSTAPLDETTRNAFLGVLENRRELKQLLADSSRASDEGFTYLDEKLQSLSQATVVYDAIPTNPYKSALEVVDRDVRKLQEVVSDIRTNAYSGNTPSEKLLKRIIQLQKDSIDKETAAKKKLNDATDTYFNKLKVESVAWYKYQTEKDKYQAAFKNEKLTPGSAGAEDQLKLSIDALKTYLAARMDTVKAKKAEAIASSECACIQISTESVKEMRQKVENVVNEKCKILQSADDVIESINKLIVKRQRAFLASQIALDPTKGDPENARFAADVNGDFKGRIDLLNAARESVLSDPTTENLQKLVDLCGQYSGDTILDEVLNFISFGRSGGNKGGGIQMGGGRCKAVYPNFYDKLLVLIEKNTTLSEIAEQVKLSYYNKFSYIETDKGKTKIFAVIKYCHPDINTEDIHTVKIAKILNALNDLAASNAIYTNPLQYSSTPEQPGAAQREINREAEREADRLARENASAENDAAREAAAARAKEQSPADSAEARARFRATEARKAADELANAENDLAKAVQESAEHPASIATASKRERAEQAVDAARVKARQAADRAREEAERAAEVRADVERAAEAARVAAAEAAAEAARAAEAERVAAAERERATQAAADEAAQRDYDTRTRERAAAQAARDQEAAAARARRDQEAAAARARRDKATREAQAARDKATREAREARDQEAAAARARRDQEAAAARAAAAAEAKLKAENIVKIKELADKLANDQILRLKSRTSGGNVIIQLAQDITIDADKDLQDVVDKRSNFQFDLSRLNTSDIKVGGAVDVYEAENSKLKTCISTRKASAIEQYDREVAELDKQKKELLTSKTFEVQRQQQGQQGNKDVKSMSDTDLDNYIKRNKDEAKKFDGKITDEKNKPSPNQNRVSNLEKERNIRQENVKKGEQEKRNRAPTSGGRRRVTMRRIRVY